MKEIVDEQRAREIVEDEIGKIVMQAAYAKNAPPGTTVVIAGETFVVTEDGELKGTVRKPYVTTAKVEGRTTPDSEA